MWNAKTAEEEKIEALNAQFVKLKDENLKLSKQIKKKSKESKDSKKDKKDDKKKDDDKTWAWKNVALTEGQKQTKKFRKKTYHWCPNHKMWTIHTPQQCEKKSNNTEEDDTNPDQAMPAVINNFEPFDDDN